MHSSTFLSAVPLLGRDLLSKLGARVTFSSEERPTFQIDNMIYLLSLSRHPPKMNGGCMSLRRQNWVGQKSMRESYLNYSLRSGQKTTPQLPRLAKHQAPVIIELKPGTILVRKRKYPLPIEAWASILPHMNRLKQAGILVECQSAWNTPILPVKKEGRQD